MGRYERYYRMQKYKKMDMYTIKSKVFKGALTFLTFQLLCEANF